MEHAGEPLSACDVRYAAAYDQGGSGRLLGVKRPTLFGTPLTSGQPGLLSLAETLGDEGWPKAVTLDDYASRRPRRPRMPQQALFAYHEAWAP